MASSQDGFDFADRKLLWLSCLENPQRQLNLMLASIGIYPFYISIYNVLNYIMGSYSRQGKATQLCIIPPIIKLTYIYSVLYEYT